MNSITDMLLLLRGLDKLYDQCVEKVRQDYRLSQIEITIVSFLHNNPGRDTAGDIALLRMRPKGNVSQGVDSLIQKNLLIRSPDREDRRKMHLALTRQALPIVEEIDRARQTYHSLIFKGFSEEELQALSEFNSRLMQNTMEHLL